MPRVRRRRGGGSRQLPWRGICLAAFGGAAAQPGLSGLWLLTPGLGRGRGWESGLPCCKLETPQTVPAIPTTHPVPPPDLHRGGEAPGGGGGGGGAEGGGGAQAPGRRPRRCGSQEAQGGHGGADAGAAQMRWACMGTRVCDVGVLRGAQRSSECTPALAGRLCASADLRMRRLPRPALPFLVLLSSLPRAPTGDVPRVQGRAARLPAQRREVAHLSVEQRPQRHTGRPDGPGQDGEAGPAGGLVLQPGARAGRCTCEGGAGRGVWGTWPALCAIHTATAAATAGANHRLPVPPAQHGAHPGALHGAGPAEHAD